MPKHDRVYQIHKDGSAEIRDGAAPGLAADGDLGVVVGALVQMSMDVQTTFTAIPDRTDALFNANVRQAFIAAGNALDYAFRLVDDIHVQQSIALHRRELDALTKRFVAESNTQPQANFQSPPGVTLTQAEQA